MVPDVEPMLASQGVPTWHRDSWVEPKVGWRARVIVAIRNFPKASWSVPVVVVALELPELRPLVGVGLAVALDGELVATERTQATVADHDGAEASFVILRPRSRRVPMATGRHDPHWAATSPRPVYVPPRSLLIRPVAASRARVQAAVPYVEGGEGGGRSPCQ